MTEGATNQQLSLNSSISLPFAPHLEILEEEFLEEVLVPIADDLGGLNSSNQTRNLSCSLY